MKKVLLITLLILAFASGCTAWQSDALPEASTPIQTVTPSAMQENFDCLKDFTCSYVTVDAEVYYKLYCKEYNLTICINQNETTMTISRFGKSMILDIPNMFESATKNAAELFLIDLTLDGIPELVYLYASNGSGSSFSTCHIIDINQIIEYPILPFTKELESSIKVYPKQLIMPEYHVLCEVVTGDGTTLYGTVQGCEGLDITDYVYIPDDKSNFTVFTCDQVNNQMKVSVGFTIDNAAPGFYLGSIDAQLAFDEERQSFKAVLPPSVSLTDPVENPADTSVAYSSSERTKG